VQRHVSAVLYLNTADEAFGETPCAAATTLCILFLHLRVLTHCCVLGGGAFSCEAPDGSGVVASLPPAAGTLLLYPSTLRHCVADVTWGTRHTLAMWLTRSGAHDEDAALLGTGAAACECRVVRRVGKALREVCACVRFAYGCAGRLFSVHGGLTAAALAARAGALEAIPGSMFCAPRVDGAGDDAAAAAAAAAGAFGGDARVRALAARGLAVLPADSDGAHNAGDGAGCEGPVRLLRRGSQQEVPPPSSSPPLPLPLLFRDASHALQARPPALPSHAARHSRR
jgi:hypothetical protein